MKRHNYTIAEYNKAMELLKLEPNMMEVSRQTGIKWSTLKNWKSGRSASYEKFKNDKTVKAPIIRDNVVDAVEYLSSLNPTLNEETRNAYYSFILGLYLGDGCITGNSLNVYLDKKYDKMNKYISFCYGELFGRPANILDRSANNNKDKCIVS